MVMVKESVLPKVAEIFMAIVEEIRTKLDYMRVVELVTYEAEAVSVAAIAAVEARAAFLAAPFTSPPHLI